jgi:hypothetical protein
MFREVEIKCDYRQQEHIMYYIRFLPSTLTVSLSRLRSIAFQAKMIVKHGQRIKYDVVVVIIVSFDKLINIQPSITLITK